MVVSNCTFKLRTYFILQRGYNPKIGTAAQMASLVAMPQFMSWRAVNAGVAGLIGRRKAVTVQHFSYRRICRFFERVLV
jgi:hypothetical protein